MRFGFLAPRAAIVLVLGTIAAAQSPSIQLADGAFKVIGWQAPRDAPTRGWPSIFAVYAGSGDIPAMVGRYAVEGGVLTFRPSFPFSPGVRYRAVFHPPGGGAPIERAFDGPPRETRPIARVERVYPTADVLPSNQLRLYIYFSAPMSRNEADRRVHLLDENGKTLDGVFLPGEELWDPGFRRLTMTFDPGRIKRGLTSNVAMGPPIAEGKRQTLVIDREWPDARGVPMAEGFRRTVRGGPADRQSPDPKQWRITAPPAGTTSPLIVDFHEPLNYPLLQRMLRVSGAAGPIPGAVQVERHETEWWYTPTAAWKAGTYQLIVDTGIEDLAGNHVGQLFDIDVFEKVTERITSATLSLPFVVR